MLSRRTLIKNSLYAGLASASPFVFAEDKGESKYKVLNAKQFVGKQIGVVNFFSYACPHCLRFEDTYRPFEQVLATKGIPCQGVPVLLDASHVTFSQAYYAFIYLGVLSPEFITHETPTPRETRGWRHLVFILRSTTP